jgi:monofunctional biosynthetic peptidoglycan transglycosylase
MKQFMRWLLCCAAALVLLEVFFIGRIALWALWAPESTSFERSQAWQIAQAKGKLPWRQQWVDYRDISIHLKRAVIASEDDAFADHDGVNWDAIEKAWEKNAKAEKRKPARPHQWQGSQTAKVVGGSTITSSWPRTCSFRVSAPWCAKPRSLC